MIAELRNRGGVGMVLLNPKIVAKIPGLWDQSEELDPTAYLKLFTVFGWRWYVLGLDPERMLAYCYVTGPGCPVADGELGAVDLCELADLTFGAGALGVERDLCFEPCRLSKLKGGER